MLNLKSLMVMMAKKKIMRNSNYCSSLVIASSMTNNNQTAPEVKQPSKNMVNSSGSVKNVPMGVRLQVKISMVDNMNPTQVLKHNGQLNSLPKNLDLPMNFLSDSKILPYNTMFVIP